MTASSSSQKSTAESVGSAAEGHADTIDMSGSASSTRTAIGSSAPSTQGLSASSTLSKDAVDILPLRDANEKSLGHFAAIISFEENTKGYFKSHYSKPLFSFLTKRFYVLL